MAMTKPPLSLSLAILSILILFTAVNGRLITFHSQSSDLVSDGVHNTTNQRSTPFLQLPFSASDTCDETYGFMPCTTTIWGNLFLILVYGYLMFTAATYLSAGSELLLEILGPGIVGGLFLPILGALPDAMLILVSGLSGDTTTAQEQVSVGMGLLAGSTVMLISVIWGSCVLVGKCDIQNSVAIDKQDTKGLSLTESGVSTDIWTSYAARIMAISVIPFIIVQLPQVLSSTSGSSLAILIALIVSVSMLIAYCLYQSYTTLINMDSTILKQLNSIKSLPELASFKEVFQPWIQKRRIAYAKHKHVISGLLKHLRMHALGRFLNDEGEPDKEVLEKIFNTIDENQDGYLSAAELKALIIGIQFEKIDLDTNDAVDKILSDFDTSNNGLIELDEFNRGITKWVDEAKHSGNSRDPGPHSTKILSDFHQQTKREHDLLGDQSDEVVEGVGNARSVTIKAVSFLVLGTIIAAVFADPLVDVVDDFSDATGIPTFFISFIALPLATNSSEAVSAIIFASRKKMRTASLTFSELYGAVTMNNLLCLSVFLCLVYVRGLTWDFSAEVLVILIVCIVMGAFASFRTTFPLWTCSVAFLLYPFSLALVYVLDYVFGWS